MAAQPDPVAANRSSPPARRLRSLVHLGFQSWIGISGTAAGDQPILRCLEMTNCDVHPLASPYSLVDHANAVEEVFPKARERGASLVVGPALNAGFYGGEPRYNYGAENTLIADDERERLAACAPSPASTASIWSRPRSGSVWRPMAPRR